MSAPERMGVERLGAIDFLLSMGSTPNAATSRDLLTEVRTLRAELSAARERAEAFSTAGHAPECNGIDELNHRCACGFLQAEGGHRYLLALESRALASEAREGELARLVKRYIEWDDGENHLGQTMPCVCDLCIEARAALAKRKE